MSTLKSYRDLVVWQKGLELAKVVYQVTSEFPKRETYGLANQLRRAAVSIPSNIAEGWGRGSRNEYLYHLAVARGSLYEVETQLLIAESQDFCVIKDAMDVCGDISRLLARLQDALTVVRESRAGYGPSDADDIHLPSEFFLLSGP